MHKKEFAEDQAKIQAAAPPQPQSLFSSQQQPQRQSSAANTATTSASSAAALAALSAVDSSHFMFPLFAGLGGLKGGDLAAAAASNNPFAIFGDALAMNKNAASK